MSSLRFRQVHLDFHTSEAIAEIGADFNKEEWQQTLRAGHVDSVTCFSKCHHGWSYHPTGVGKIHPHLSFDLLRAQFDACKEIGVNVPLYLSAGVDEVAVREHPEWREVSHDGRYAGWSTSNLQPGFKTVCFNTPYLEYLLEQIREAVRLFPDCNGVFLDIVSQSPCCCRWCMELMANNGLNPEKEEDRKKCAEMVLMRYYQEATAACQSVKPDMPVFHNSGNLIRGRRNVLPFFSHLELESLPTGGWGYDHFPLSAKYCANLGFPYLGMTGKFHTSWGEFGGFKHPNALRYECAAMLAYGARCSIGDQLHPRGRLDPGTYALIGAAYADIEMKEAYVIGAKNIADIGLVSAESLHTNGSRDNDADIGAVRALLEEHLLFDVLDAEMDFSPYALVVLPDEISIDELLKAKLDAYLDKGGKLFLTGRSGLDKMAGRFIFDIGADYHGESSWEPEYMLPSEDLRPAWMQSPMVMYGRGQCIRVSSGESLGQVYEPYFNRDWRHFCSHQHTPPRPTPSGYDCGVITGNICYCAHPVFTIYKQKGATVLRHFIGRTIRRMLGGKASASVMGLPSSGRMTLMEQKEQKRRVLHLLYAEKSLRGRFGENPIEIIEDLLPVRGVEVTVAVPQKIRKASLEPQGTEIPFVAEKGVVRFTIAEFTCHQMVVLWW